MGALVGVADVPQLTSTKAAASNAMRMCLFDMVHLPVELGRIISLEEVKCKAGIDGSLRGMTGNAIDLAAGPEPAASR